jgi:CheY-like chemotaxis protein
LTPLWRGANYVLQGVRRLDATWRSYVPTILIADDNSNIQKMVALALKGEGIDVVAVGNGEAAVRKAPDLKPDLVLADIFMPVRNGYEVCEFIKQNTKLAHVPVILLAGAFDPFDEKEAQRVGADGVLKKPFVPPDPLVNLVKELLAKSAALHLVPVSVAAVAEMPAANASIAARAAEPEQVAPRVIPPAPTAFDLPADDSPADDLPTETGPEEVRPFKDFTYREEAGHSASEGGSSAFASLMDSGLGLRVEFPEVHKPLPISEESETEEAPAKEFSGFTGWQSRTPAIESAASALEERTEEPPSTLYTPGIVRPARGWDIERVSGTRPEDETMVEPADHFAATHFPAQSAGPAEHSTEDSSEDSADAFPIYRAEQQSELAEIEASGLHEEPVAEAVPDASDWVDMGAEQRHSDAPADEVAEPHAEASAETSVETHAEPGTAFHSPFAMDDTQTIDAIRSSAMPWHSVPSALREPREEFGKQSSEPAAEYLPQHFASQYSSSRESAVKGEPPTEESAKPFGEEWNTGETKSSAKEPDGATDAVVHDATDYEAPVYDAVSEGHQSFDSTHDGEMLSTVIHSSEVESLVVAAPTALSAQQIEDIVSRVVERMQPQVLEVITKEILRPVVEALVRKQLEQK